MSGDGTSLADQTAVQTNGSTGDVAVAAGEALAEAALRVGFALMTISAASDTLFALLDGGSVLAGLEGAILTGLGLGGLLRPATAARLLRPPGRVVVLAALFAVAGAFDWGIQSHFDEVAPAIMWIAVIVSSPALVVACVVVSAAGYLVDLLLKGHSLAWTLTPTGRELVINQWVDLVANAGIVFVLVVLLRRFIAGVPARLAAARGGDNETVVATAPPPAGAVTTLGQTEWSPGEAVKFFRALALGCLLPAEQTSYVLNLMEHIEPGESWGPESSGYLVRQSGIIDPGSSSGAVVAIVAFAPSFGAGTEMLTRTASWLNQHLHLSARPSTGCG